MPQDSEKNISWLRLPGRLAWDLVFTALCLLVISAVALLLGAAAWAAPAFLICWIVVRIWYWLISRIPMWLDLDRINLGRIHQWPLFGNILLCLAIFVVTWGLLRGRANDVIGGYATSVRKSEVTGPAVKALECAGAWLSDKLGVGPLFDFAANLVARVEYAVSWAIDGVITILRALRGLPPPEASGNLAMVPTSGHGLFALLMLATLVVLLQVTGDAKRLRMIEKARLP